MNSSQNKHTAPSCQSVQTGAIVDVAGLDDEDEEDGDDEDMAAGEGAARVLMLIRSSQSPLFRGGQDRFNHSVQAWLTLIHYTTLHTPTRGRR
jgi:hypothetical protein